MQSTHFFFVRSDSNVRGPDECCSAREVRQRSIEFYPHWYVSRPGLCSKGSGGSDSSAAGAPLSLEMCHRGTLQNYKLKLGEHVMSVLSLTMIVWPSLL